MIDIDLNPRFAIWKERLEKLFFVLFFLVSFLQYSSFSVGRGIISLVQWPAVFLGAFLLLERVFFFRRYFVHPTVWLLFSFCVSFFVSTVSNFSYGYYENLRGFVFLLFEIFLLFAVNEKEDAFRSARKTELAVTLFQAGTFALSAISLVLLIFQVSLIFPQEEGPVIVIGFAWGRLFGAYWDPNIASAMASVSLLFSVFHHFFSASKAKRIFARFNFFIQLGYLSFSDSRTGLVALALGATVLSFLWMFHHWAVIQSKRKIIAAWASIGLSVLIFLGSFLMPFLVKQSAIGIESLFLEEGEVSFFDDSERENDLRADISNRRFDIWKSAVELGMEKPLVGVSHFNILSYVRAELPQSYLITNDHLDFETMHNVLFDVFASQGFLGLLLFVSVIIISLFALFKHRKKGFSTNKFFINTTFFCVLITVFSASMFMTEIVYVISPLTLIFWISFGKVIRDIIK